jgi:E3 ubiquitin-protein ligase HECTD1
MAPIYLKFFLPVFCKVFQSTMLPSVRRSSLGLIKKMVQYVQPDTLANLCSEPIEPNLGTLLVEVVASVLDNEVSRKLFSSHSYYIFFNILHFNW